MWIVSKAAAVSYCFTFRKVMELRITEAATRVHQIHFRATRKKSEQPKNSYSLFLWSSFVFSRGNKSAL